ncbi:MAG: acetyl-CoA carboxylase biotin carboxyl carrier protein [Lactobacillales bacterium]|jgi:acetyl-CoA carboxylase biotin carboxyl carrier protein|nr:acetyl-CoA carboxylase biotin carboxyl carrier protein [Lactobacillales bacterium]
MNIQEVKELVSQFDGSSLREFDLRKGDFEIYLSKNETYGRVTQPVAVAQVAPSTPTPPVVEGTSTSVTTEEVVVEAVGELITSPIVGVVYLQPAPEKPAFVKVGDKVSEGETVCIVEAMKMMNEVPSDISGEIMEVLVENEQVVGIGDPLFRVKGV